MRPFKSSLAAAEKSLDPQRTAPYSHGADGPPQNQSAYKLDSSSGGDETRQAVDLAWIHLRLFKLVRAKTIKFQLEVPRLAA